MVIVGHSYGGIPAALKGQTVKERASMRGSGLLVTAYVVPEHGKDLRLLGGKYPDWTEP